MIFENWSKARQWLLPAIERTHGTHNEDDILRGLMNGQFNLWLFSKSAIVTEFVTYPRMKTLNWFLVGGDMDELLSMAPGIEKWAKEQQCSRVTCGGRRGWERVLKDYSFGGVYLHKDLP